MKGACVKAMGVAAACLLAHTAQAGLIGDRIYIEATHNHEIFPGEFDSYWIGGGSAIVDAGEMEFRDGVGLGIHPLDNVYSNDEPFFLEGAAWFVDVEDSAITFGFEWLFEEGATGPATFPGWSMGGFEIAVSDLDWGAPGTPSLQMADHPSLHGNPNSWSSNPSTWARFENESIIFTIPENEGLFLSGTPNSPPRLSVTWNIHMNGAQVVPEPSTSLLAGLGIGLLAARRIFSRN